jgi:membrane protein implicated in regulation of membrane protease activity
MVVLKKIGVMSYAAICTIVMAILGIILDIGYAIMPGSPLSGLGIFAVVFTIVLTPIMYAAIGFVGGAISALLYNLVARWVGGVKLELK